MLEKLIFAANKRHEMNANVIFVKKFVSDAGQGSITISASNLYKLYVNGTFIGCGPARTAKEYGKTDFYNVNFVSGENIVAAIVCSYNVSNYEDVMKDPYFCIEAAVNGKIYSATDFNCYDYDARVKNTQRYSYQRGFAEIYRFDCEFFEYLKNLLNNAEPLRTDESQELKFLSRNAPYPTYNKTVLKSYYFRSYVKINESASVWNDRTLDKVGDKFEGFLRKDLYECLTDTACKFVLSDSGAPIYFYDFNRNITGFIDLNIAVKSDASIYLLFDEILSDRQSIVNFRRLDCCNVVKYELHRGKYTLQTLEPYVLRYLQVVVASGDAVIESVGVTMFENPTAFNFNSAVEDKDLQVIIDAGRNTVAQNSVDILMDCPSRERSGWINDIYFSKHSAEMFLGGKDIEYNSLENYLLASPDKSLPEGVIQMTYPANHIDGIFIQQNCMWYVINFCEIINLFDEERKTKGKKQIAELLDVFSKYENEDGLLENLDGWNFIEWSKAAEFCNGVNYPTNMLYYKMLVEINSAYPEFRLKEKFMGIKRKIKEQSFNGIFFEDNRIRNDNDQLVSTGNISEVCQYYAILTGIADDMDDSYYDLIVKNFGVFRDEKHKYPNVVKSNIIIGLLARIDFLRERSEYERALKEIKEMFLVMAKNTGTLWEHVNTFASCNHGVAAFGAYTAVRILCGYVGIQNGIATFDKNYYGKCNCQIVFSSPCGEVKVSVKDGVRVIGGEYVIL